MLPTGRESLFSKRFGLVSAYDGTPANVGRVVCDSTWHHWLSMNLIGIDTEDAGAYRKMQSYYRNVGLWLAGPAQRRSMLVAGVWGAMTGSWPGFFTREQSEWEMGERALKVLAGTMSPCGIDEVVAPFLGVKATRLRYVSGEGRSAPQWGGLSVELANRAVVGAICRSMLEPASDYLRALTRFDHVPVDVEQLHGLATRGAEQGLELLRRTLADAAASFTTLRDEVRSVGRGPYQNEV
jgi:hypothetical protein